MVHQKSGVDVSTLNLSAEDNVAVETGPVNTDLCSPVKMDVVQIEIVSQGEHKVATTMEEVASEKMVVANIEVNANEEIMAEEEGEDEEHAAKKEEYGDDDNYDDEDEDEEFDDFDDEEDEVDVDVDDVDNDNDDLLEEAGNVENKGDDVFEDKDNQESTMEGEREKEENEEKGGRSLEPKVKKLWKKNGRKLVVKRDLGKVTSKSEDKLKGDEQDDPTVGKDRENAKQAIEEKGEGISKENVRKLRKRNKGKVTNGNSEKVASKLEDKREASGRKKASKKVESMGMIFMCSSKTKKDCYHYKVLGLPASKRDIVGKIYKGMRLFLYDVDLKLLYGIYKAAGPGGYNIEPNAFKSQFPSQVRFTVLEDCIPLVEEKFKKVIKENYFTRTKFDCQLKSDQVKKLCKLFVAASKGPKSKRLDRSRKAHGSIDRDRSRARVAGKKRHSAFDEKRQYRDYPHIRQREVVEPPLAPPARIAHLPSPISTPSYAYDRTLGTDAYRQNLLVEHRDSYRRPILVSQDAYRREPLLEHRDSYRRPILESQDAYRREPLLDHRDSFRREPLLEQRDVYRRDSLLDHRDSYRRDPLLEQRGVYSQEPLLNQPDSYRRDVIVEHREIRPIKVEVRRGDEIAGHDPYISYRERQSYRDPVYVEHLSPERDRYHPVGLRPEYRSREATSPEYRSTRARYRY